VGVWQWDEGETLCRRTRRASGYEAVSVGKANNALATLALFLDVRASRSTRLPTPPDLLVGLGWRNLGLWRACNYNRPVEGNVERLYCDLGSNLVTHEKIAGGRHIIIERAMETNLGDE